MAQTSRKVRIWIVISVIWFLLATVVGLYLAYHLMDDEPSYFDIGKFHIFFILNAPLVLGWSIWLKDPSLLKHVDNFLTGYGSKDESRDRLRIMLSDGLDLLNKLVNTELEFRKWETDDKNWTSAVYRELKRGSNESLAVSFQSVESGQEFDLVSSFNSEHNTRQLLLNKRLNILDNIIK